MEASRSSMKVAWSRHAVATRRGRTPCDATRLTELEAPAVRDPGATLSAWAPSLDGRVVFVGDGAAQYGDRVRSAQPEATVLGSPILAGTIGLIAVSRATAGQTLEPA